MEGLARTLGHRERRIEVGRKTYTLSSPRLRDFMRVELEIMKSLPDPMAEACKVAKDVRPEDLDAFWKAARRASLEAKKVDFEHLGHLPQMIQVAVAAYLVLQRHHARDIGALADAMDWIEACSESVEGGLKGLQTIIGGVMDAATAEGDPGKNPDAGPPTGPA